MTTASSSFADIPTSGSEQSSEDYGFTISSDCPEKEVTFTLEITSDEGSWTDQFTVQVYLEVPPMPSLIYFSHQIDDNTSTADNDGLAGTGRNNQYANYHQKYWGMLMLSNVSAVLSASDPLIQGCW